MLAAPAPATAANRYHYRRDGFTVVEAGLPPAVMTGVRGHLDALIAGLGPDERPEHLVEPHVNAPDWRFWLQLCLNPAVLAAVARAMEADELVLAMSHLIVKPPFDGKAVAWHQDITYWPSVTGSEVCTVWLAVDDVDTGNACVHFIPRSHAERERLEKLATDGSDLLQVRVAVTPEQEASAVPCILRCGQYSIHDSFAIHGSGVNTSARRRAGYTMRYANPKVVSIDASRHWVPVDYVYGDGTSLRPEMRDLRPGRPLPDAPRGRPLAAPPLRT